MLNNKVEITQEVSKRILEKVIVVSEPGVYEAKHRVSEESFIWENSGDEDTAPSSYRIINTNITTPYLAQEANDLFEQGEFSKAANKTLSFRANLDLAKELTGSLRSQIFVDYTVLKKTGEEALMIREMKPIAATIGTKFTFKTKDPLAVASELINAELVTE